MNKPSGKDTSVLNSKDINQHQRETFFLNLLHIHLSKNKISDAKKLISDIEKSEISLSEQLTNRLNISLLLLEKKYSEALEKMKQPSSVFEALCRAQVQLYGGKLNEAVQGLIQYCYDNNVKNSRVLSFLLKACVDGKFNEEKQKVIDLAMKNLDSLSKDLLSIIGHILYESQDYQQAYEVFDRIKNDTGDLKVKAGYLSSLAEKDVKAAADYFEVVDFRLPEAETEEDLHDLLEQPLENIQNTKKREKKDEIKIEETKKGFIQKAKTKKKKVKYPKNFDPENPGPMPDPERWIPKWQRSKGKKKLRMKGPQGDVKNIGMHSKKQHTTANIEASSGAGGRRK